MFGKYNINNVLVLAPHTDDGEIGCGGLIALAIEQGLNVHYVAFSSAQISLPEGAPRDTLIKEVKAATEVLGILQENLILFDYPTRRMAEFRQDILDDMITIREQIKPDLILTPSLHDIHQDHQTIANETLRCFKRQSILCYEEPWNNISFATQCFVKLDKHHIDKKVQALLCYESQMRRTYLNEESIRALALTRGTQLEGGYAEAFEVVRWMI
ncbi:MAG: LmbE family protein [Legionellales bacterium]|nr:LmbE family protein [Legionellales bacterium]|tara:strand:- start:34991 stop:35632 length:642 start_codon:yes stop_codon:yes gene_type:complete